MTDVVNGDGRIALGGVALVGVGQRDGIELGLGGPDAAGGLET